MSAKHPRRSARQRKKLEKKRLEREAELKRLFPNKLYVIPWVDGKPDESLAFELGRCGPLEISYG